MPSILFVCTGNQFRSPLAAGYMRDFISKAKAPGEWKIESAGTWAAGGMPAAEVTRRIANEQGLEGIVEHKSRPVNGGLLEQFDLILVMETGHREGIASEFPESAGRTRLLSEVVDGVPYSIEDVLGEDRGPDDVAAELQTLIQRGGSKILKLAESLHSGRQSQPKGDG